MAAGPIDSSIKTAITASLCCCVLVVQCLGQANSRVVRKTSDQLMKMIVKWQKPAYPAIGNQVRASGPVEVELLIDEQGNVVSVRAVSGHPLLRAGTVSAAYAWKFKPATLRGIPVKLSGRVTYTFPAIEGLSEAKTVSELEHTVRATPLSAEAHYELGSAYLKAVRYAEAVTQFSRAIQIKPRYAEAHLKLGHTYSRLGSYEQARDAFTRATELDPDSSEAFQALGLAYMSMGKTEDAIKALKSSLQVEGPITTSHFLLGKCYFSLNRYEEAVASYKQGLAKYSDSDMGHFGLGEVYLSQEKFTDAITEFQQAIKLSEGPGLSNAHYYLGLAFLRGGDRQSADKEYEILRKLNPELAAQLQVEIKK